ncbi:beta-lactamase domain protein [Haloterrigena turkmenica DSM 5511]|uniref:Beta-lactamase domain protein n=1 Tax=Haloterrigena turkmenica (strain ATCC 51198 / DSM 5511 / JCM 9101 / NCIMB 13204 / VKM B-1734 / 4k) TaxID=543526 RepID=D2RXP0_HALTV|nr:MBL fold metallo-hydrolase [Haloterrigena turkmenica]ADB59724.1 beta-lactamase domain protein [Haloterrigena turkmenica DSM 5511]
MTLSNVTDGIDQVQFDHVRVLVLEDVPEGQTTLVDTAFDENGEELVETLEAEYGDIDRVILTHGDHGHHGGLEHVMDAFDPKLVMPADESKLYEHFEEAGLDIEPDVAYEDGDLLEGDIRVIQVPGHTEATSALLLEERGVLISGDALDGSDRGGMPPGYLLPPPALFNIDHEAAELNLYDLLGYDFDTVLVFHGSHVFENPKQKLDDFLVEREWNEWDPRTDDE